MSVGLRTYKPSYADLHFYRASSIPFVDFHPNERGLFTVNASCWREKRLFTEMLQEAGADEQTAWEEITQLVKEQPQLIISMFQDALLDISNPRRFFFGSRSNAQRVRFLFVTHHPNRQLPSPPARKKQPWLSKKAKREKWERKIQKLMNEGMDD